ncbi:TPA: hypothetical protein ACGWER_002018 [Streptococcus agalactiae]|nr:hypothetical protein [Streptococcus agalactiae]
MTEELDLFDFLDNEFESAIQGTVETEPKEEGQYSKADITFLTDLNHLWKVYIQMLTNYNKTKWRANTAYLDFLDQEQRKSLENAKAPYLEAKTYKELKEIAEVLEACEKRGGLLCGGMIYLEVKEHAQQAINWTFEGIIPEQLLSLPKFTGNPFNQFSDAKKPIGFLAHRGYIYA